MKKNYSLGNHLTEKVPIKHFLLIMRTTFILLFTCIFCSMAEMSYTQNARVTINKRNVTLKEVLNEIEKQTDYLFIYSDEVDTNEKVSVKSKQQAVSNVLHALLKNKDVVSNFCNDVVGDICGIVSGAAGAAIGIRIVVMSSSLSETLVGIGISSLIAACTVGGKAWGKKIALRKNKKIVIFLGSVIHFFKFNKN